MDYAAHAEMHELGGTAGGFSHIRKNLKQYYDLSKREYVLIITDLDRNVCAPTLRREWLRMAKISEPLPERMLLCIAKTEVESWLMADATGISKFLAINATKLQNNIEEDVIDAKEYLVDLAKKSTSREIRIGVAPEKGNRAKTGLNYNRLLAKFATQTWSPRAAAENSMSLRRAIDKISQAAI